MEMITFIAISRVLFILHALHPLSHKVNAANMQKERLDLFEFLSYTHNGAMIAVLVNHVQLLFSSGRSLIMIVCNTCANIPEMHN